MTGRVLTEAFHQGALPSESPRYRKIETAMGFGTGIVHMKEFDGNRYIISAEVEE